MGDSKSRPSRMVWSFLAPVAACLASGAALAQVTTTSPVPLTYFLIQQPVDVCTDQGTNCAFINNSLQTVLSSSYTCTANGVNTKCANIFADFIDPVTGMLAGRNIAAAYGIDYRQTPVVQFNRTASQTVQVDSCTSGSTGCKSASFSALAQQPQLSTMTNPPTQPNVPTFPRNGTPTVLNHFLVKNICSAAKQGCTIGDVVGFGALNGNGFATSNLMYFPASTGSPDAGGFHEEGHNLALDHLTLGAGGANNLMTAAAGMPPRTVPNPLPPPGSKMDAWVTEIFPNASSPLDQLTVGTCTSLASCNNQQGAVLLSGFLNASPSASTSLQPQFSDSASVNNANKPPPPLPPHWVIGSGPLCCGFGGDSSACRNSDICNHAYLAEAVIVLTTGKFDNSSGHSFQILNQSSNPVLAEPPEIQHGDNGNDACIGQGPGVWCADLKFVPGAITLANRGFIDFTIGTKPVDISGLAGNVCYFWNTADGAPYYPSCADLSSVFSGLGSDSQLVNLALNLFIPLNFPGTPGNSPCTLIPPATTCTDPTSSYPTD
jgi:hypothetical protein